MIAAFRPWMIWAAMVALLLALLGVQTVRLSESEANTAAEKAAHAETKRLHAQALAAAISEARKRENQLRSDLEGLQATAAKEKADAKAREVALVESVRSGQRRLSVAAVCPDRRGTGLRAPVAGGGGAEVQRAELAPEVGVALIGIATDGDEAIRERNACVDAYNAVRERLNKIP